MDISHEIYETAKYNVNITSSNFGGVLDTLPPCQQIKHIGFPPLPFSISIAET